MSQIIYLICMEMIETPGTFAKFTSQKISRKDAKFIQLYHQGWDHHGSLNSEIKVQCKETDQPTLKISSKEDY